VIALTACDHLRAAFVAAVAEYEPGEPLRCPESRSYQLKTFHSADASKEREESLPKAHSDRLKVLGFFRVVERRRPTNLVLEDQRVPTA